MPDLLVKEQELQQLDRLLGEVPYKYVTPIAQLFNQIHQTRAKENAEGQLKEESNKTLKAVPKIENDPELLKQGQDQEAAQD
jgi:hypothetical protein